MLTKLSRFLKDKYKLLIFHVPRSSEVFGTIDYLNPLSAILILNSQISEKRFKPSGNSYSKSKQFPAVIITDNEVCISEAANQ